MQDSDGPTLGSKPPEVGDAFKDRQKSSSNSFETSLPQHDDLQSGGTFLNQSNNSSAVQAIEAAELLGNVSKESSSIPVSTGTSPPSCIQKATTISNRPVHSARRRTMWGRTSVSICFGSMMHLFASRLLFLVMFLQLYLLKLYLV